MIHTESGGAGGPTSAGYDEGGGWGVAPTQSISGSRRY